MSKFFPGQDIRVRINGITLAVMVRAVGPFADEPNEAEWPDIVHHPAAPERVAETSTGGYPIGMIERSRVDALERRADTRDTTLAKLEASINDVFRQLEGIRSRAKAEELEGRERDRRLDALEQARAWIDTQEVKARMDNHNERLRNLQDRITEIEKVAEAASRFFKLSPKGD